MATITEWAAAAAVITLERQAQPLPLVDRVVVQVRPVPVDQEHPAKATRAEMRARLLRTAAAAEAVQVQ